MGSLLSFSLGKTHFWSLMSDFSFFGVSGVLGGKHLLKFVSSNATAVGAFCVCWAKVSAHRAFTMANLGTSLLLALYSQTESMFRSLGRYASAMLQTFALPDLPFPNPTSVPYMQCVALKVGTTVFDET